VALVNVTRKLFLAFFSVFVFVADMHMHFGGRVSLDEELKAMLICGYQM
jgi:hypothetical protein